MQIQAQVEGIQKTNADLMKDQEDAKSKQKSAKDDIKRIEQDMAEFKDNKEGKTDQLRVGCTMVDHRS